MTDKGIKARILQQETHMLGMGHEKGVGSTEGRLGSLIQSW